MVNKGTCRGVYESKTNVDKVVCEGNLSSSGEIHRKRENGQTAHIRICGCDMM